MPEIFPSLLQFEKKKKKHGGVPGPLFSHTSSGPFFVGKKLGGCLPIKKSSPGGNSSSSPSLYTWQYLWPRDFFVGDFGSGCIIWWWYIFTREWKGWNPVCWVKSRISFHSFNICIYIYIYTDGLQKLWKQLCFVNLSNSGRPSTQLQPMGPMGKSQCP